MPVVTVSGAGGRTFSDPSMGGAAYQPTAFDPFGYSPGYLEAFGTQGFYPGGLGGGGGGPGGIVLGPNIFGAGQYPPITDFGSYVSPADYYAQVAGGSAAGGTGPMSPYNPVYSYGAGGTQGFSPGPTGVGGGSIGTNPGGGFYQMGTYIPPGGSVGSYSGTSGGFGGGYTLTGVPGVFVTTPSGQTYSTRIGTSMSPTGGSGGGTPPLPRTAISERGARGIDIPSHPGTLGDDGNITARGSGESLRGGVYSGPTYHGVVDPTAQPAAYYPSSSQSSSQQNVSRVLPYLHSGGLINPNIPSGGGGGERLGPDERSIVGRLGEGVFTEEQMRNMLPIDPSVFRPDQLRAMHPPPGIPGGGPPGPIPRTPPTGFPPFPTLPPLPPNLQGLPGYFNNLRTAFSPWLQMVPGWGGLAMMGR